jgi:hypothetical protein
MLLLQSAIISELRRGVQEAEGRYEVCVCELHVARDQLNHALDKVREADTRAHAMRDEMETLRDSIQVS